MQCFLPTPIHTCFHEHFLFTHHPWVRLILTCIIMACLHSVGIYFCAFVFLGPTYSMNVYRSSPLCFLFYLLISPYIFTQSVPWYSPLLSNCDLHSFSLEGSIIHLAVLTKSHCSFVSMSLFAPVAIHSWQLQPWLAIKKLRSLVKILNKKL